MPWGQEQWGEGQWGEDLPVSLSDFVDSGGNALALPASANFFGFEASEDIAGRNEFYELHLRSMREIDEQQGSFFWKRFCEGPEDLRKRLESNVDALSTLLSITDIDDRFIRYKLPQLGWTRQFDSITSKLTNDQVRALLSSSARLWKNRGAAGSAIEALNSIAGVGAWEWDWFSRRFVIGKARFGQDETPSSGWTDARFTNVKSRNVSELRIADPDRQLDRELIADILKAWRPTGERYRVVFVELWDRFADDSRPWVRYESQGLDGEPTIASGTLQLSNSGVEEHAFAESSALLKLENYMVKARVRSTEAAGYYGIAVGFDGTFSTALEFRLYSSTHELKVFRNAIELFAFDLLHDFQIALVPNAWHTMRVVVDGQRIVIYLDNVKLLEGDAMGLINAGTSGVVHGVGSSVECDHFEIVPIPGEVMFIDINT